MAENAEGEKRLAVLVIGLAVLLVAAPLLLLALLHWTPQFYRRAAREPGAGRERESKQFLNRASQLAGDVRTEPHWEAVFTEDQINAWLAEEFAELAGRYTTVASTGLEAPRVSLADGEVLVGFTRRRWLSFVVWARLHVWMAEPGIVAVRVCELRAGALPFPIERIRELADALAQRARATIEWRQIDGDPVALVNLDMHDALGNLRRIDVADDQFFISSVDHVVAERVRQTGGGAR